MLNLEKIKKKSTSVEKAILNEIASREAFKTPLDNSRALRRKPLLTGTPLTPNYQIYTSTLLQKYTTKLAVLICRRVDV